MLDFLLKGLGDGKSISFYKLYSNLRRWSDANTYPSEHELPESITFPADFWKRVIQMYKSTRNDEFERAISVFWADGDLIFSDMETGNRQSITPKASVQVRYSPTTKRDYIRKEVFLNEKRYSKRDIYYKKVPKQIDVKYLFNMHTHPPHFREDGSVFYSFFSAQDLKSLVASKVGITCMIGDRFWLLFRTNQTPANLDHIIDSQINMEFLYKELHIVTYAGEFKSKLVKQVV